jgi:hypothetical protein
VTPRGASAWSLRHPVRLRAVSCPYREIGRKRAAHVAGDCGETDRLQARRDRKRPEPNRRMLPHSPVIGQGHAHSSSDRRAMAPSWRSRRSVAFIIATNGARPERPHPAATLVVSPSSR